MLTGEVPPDDKDPDVGEALATEDGRVLIALVAIWVVAIPATVVVGAWALAVRRERRARRHLYLLDTWSVGPQGRPLSVRRVAATPRVRRGCEISRGRMRARARGVWPE
jgi:hypothetical protein